MESSTTTIINLQAEIDRLNKKIFLLERANREYQKEITAYEEAQKELLSEIQSLQANIINLQRQNITQGILTRPAENLNDLLYPKLNDEHTPHAVGMESDWEEMMYGFTDEIFIENETPDVLLIRNDEERCYMSATGFTRLYYPITETTLKEHNILKIKKLTDEEVAAEKRRNGWE